MTIRNLDPVQFNFAVHWHTSVREVRERPKLKAAFEAIRDEACERAEDHFEDEHDFDEEQAKASFGLRIHEAQVLYRDLDWLREHFDNPSLYQLVEAIATELYPQMIWEVIESQDGEQIIVTNRERTLVFDMDNFDKLSAKASLLLAEDRSFVNDREAMEEVHAFVEARYRRLKSAVEQVEESLRQYRDPNVPLELNLERSPVEENS